LGRRADLIVEDLGEEIVAYDELRDVACSLNATAASVWRNCDGLRTVDDLVKVLHADVGEFADEDLVLVTLDRLHEQGLIDAGYEPRDPETARFSRRRFLATAGVAAVVALPVIEAVVAPSAAAALSNK
jgi:hypothetical protein